MDEDENGIDWKGKKALVDKPYFFIFSKRTGTPRHIVNQTITYYICAPSFHKMQAKPNQTTRLQVSEARR